MAVEDIHIGTIVTGPLLPDPVEVLALVAMGDAVKLIGEGSKTNLVRDSVLNGDQHTQLRIKEGGAPIGPGDAPGRVHEHSPSHRRLGCMNFTIRDIVASIGQGDTFDADRHRYACPAAVESAA
jgi:hypothetical protein